MSEKREEVLKILESVEKADVVIEYINELEKNLCKCKDKESQHDEHCHHHHDEDCDCGCHNDDNEWVEIKDSFGRDLTVNEWENILKDSTCFSKDELKLLKRFRHVAIPTSAYELADQFGEGGAVWYTELINNIGNAVAKKLGLNDYINKDNWFILFKAWNKSDEGIIYYGLKTELYEAIGNVDFSKVNLWG